MEKPPEYIKCQCQHLVTLGFRWSETVMQIGLTFLSKCLSVLLDQRLSIWTVYSTALERCSEKRLDHWSSLMEQESTRLVVSRTESAPVSPSSMWNDWLQNQESFALQPCLQQTKRLRFQMWHGSCNSLGVDHWGFLLPDKQYLEVSIGLWWATSHFLSGL